MADGIFASLVSRTRDANSASNVLFTQLADNGGNAVTVTGNKLDVNASVTLETAYVDDSAFTIGTDKVNAQGFLADETATDSVDEGDIGLARMTLDRRMITSSEQSGTWNIGTVTAVTDITNVVSVDDNGASLTVDNTTLSVVGGGTEAAALRVTIANDSTGLLSIDDNGGSLTVDGTVAATQSGVWNIGTVASITADVNIADGGNSITVDAVALDIRALSDATDSVQIGDGTDTLAVNTDGSINVNFTKTTITGEIHDYDTAAAVASDATSNHDYTVANTVFLLTSVIVSGSGNIKFEIQTGPVGALVTKAVGFLTGRQGDTKQINFDPAIEVPVTSTGTVRIIRTNRQGAATDLYSTIIGIDQ